MNSKTNTVLLFILIILVLGFGGWMVFGKGGMQNTNVLPDQYVATDDTTGSTANNNQQPTQPKMSNATVDASFNAMTDASLMQLAKDNQIFFEQGAIDLTQLTDLTGDGLHEGIFTGSGGNSGLAMILIKQENGSTLVAKQKNKDGSIAPVSLISVGRVKVQEGYELLPSENGFYTISKVYNEQKDLFECNENGIHVYKWNTASKMFEWNQALTTKYGNQVCH